MTTALTRAAYLSLGLWAAAAALATAGCNTAPVDRDPATARGASGPTPADDPTDLDGTPEATWSVCDDAPDFRYENATTRCTLDWDQAAADFNAIRILHPEADLFGQNRSRYLGNQLE